MLPFPVPQDSPLTFAVVVVPGRERLLPQSTSRTDSGFGPAGFPLRPFPSKQAAEKASCVYLEIPCLEEPFFAVEIPPGPAGKVDGVERIGQRRVPQQALFVSVQSFLRRKEPLCVCVCVVGFTCVRFSSFLTCTPRQSRFRRLPSPQDSGLNFHPRIPPPSMPIPRSVGSDLSLAGSQGLKEGPRRSSPNFGK